MVNEHKTPWLAALALAVAVAAAALGGFGDDRPVAAQSGETAIAVTAPVDAEVSSGDDPVPFTISVENVDNLGGFQFVLLYDADVFEFSEVQRTEFLGSTQREVVCNEPTVAAGSMRWSCVTLGPTPPGVEGSGAIATVLLDPTGSGSTDVSLDRVQLAKADETATLHEDVAVRNTAIDVAGSSGFNWLLWGPVIAVVALVVLGGGAFAAMRMRDSKPASATGV